MGLLITKTIHEVAPTHPFVGPPGTRADRCHLYWSNRTSLKAEEPKAQTHRHHTIYSCSSRFRLFRNSTYQVSLSTSLGSSAAVVRLTSRSRYWKNRRRCMAEVWGMTTKTLWSQPYGRIRTDTLHKILQKYDLVGKISRKHWDSAFAVDAPVLLLASSTMHIETAHQPDTQAL